ncbi:MAG: UDP-N-acetylmuramoyl-L-alanine--D-glutamate ligase [Clostridiales bacterium]|nr:UDP-N-acetylmuramoyl-L-alanine--D-glutamate ligase [Clostridiales bacterium]
MNPRYLAFKEYVKGKRVDVIGMGVSNTPVVDMLLDMGAKVCARDVKKREEKADLADMLEQKGVRVLFGEHYLENLDTDMILKAPGIRFDRTEFVKAVADGAVLTSEMELFFALCPATIFGVTGSDGKTTTTTLIYEMLKRQHGRVYVGGNIGQPLLPLVHEMKEEDFAVVELSSFQLHTMKRSPDVAVITNVSPNHLDWHTGMQEYIDAKKNMFRYQTARGRLVLNFENEGTRAMADEAPAPVTFFSSKGQPKGAHAVYEREGAIYLDQEKILNTDDILIPGQHNVENYMAAIGAVQGFVDKENIREVARTFPGVEHRIEFVREHKGVLYYNSSIDSSPTRTEAALRSFKQKVIVILGGYDKNIPFEPLAVPVKECVKAAILTGKTADKIENALKDTGVPLYRASDLAHAVHTASDLAREGDIVLLSPACASFDAFANFMERGNIFKELVKELS